jgi:predicted RNA-binding Zn-ribbon protein involved in translation (DUF1610 family)
MIIVDASWTPEVNWLKIRCSCGQHFEHRADRWWVRCPECGRREHIEVLRLRYSSLGGKKGEDP